MTDLQKAGIIFLAFVALIYVKVSFFYGPSDDVKEVRTETKELKEEDIPEDVKVEQEKPREYVNIFFIGQNDKKEEVYKAVRREYKPKNNESKLKFALESLMSGPIVAEKNKGVYTEVPAMTKIISITESPNKVTINLSSDFEQGGGTESIYKRLFQLIKTAKRNTNLPIYLQLDGKQVDVIGGEGIMITQPLREDFINE